MEKEYQPYYYISHAKVRNLVEIHKKLKDLEQEFIAILHEDVLNSEKFEVKPK